MTITKNGKFHKEVYMKINTTKNVKYDSQREFAAHLKEMLDEGYTSSNLNFPKRDKQHFTVAYVKDDDND